MLVPPSVRSSVDPMHVMCPTRLRAAILTAITAKLSGDARVRAGC
jgi:hypothetical protein